MSLPNKAQKRARARELAQQKAGATVAPVNAEDEQPMLDQPSLSTEPV